MNLLHPELETMWTDYYIPPLETIYEYYRTWIYDYESAREMRNEGTLLYGYTLDEAWANWYELNKTQFF